MLADLFRCFRQGAAWILGSPAWTAALVALGVLLGAFAPWLQLRLGLPDHFAAQVLMIFAATLPISLYGMLLYMLRLDALALDGPSNPRATWRETFEVRWLPAVGARMLVGLGMALGFLLFVVPCLMVLAAFGWAPTLVLLRGFTIRRALRGSLRIMAASAPRVIFVALGAFLTTQLVTLAVATASPFKDDQITALLRLRHPFFWAVNAISTLLDLWLGATLLALFHSVEGPAHEADPAEDTED